MALRSVDSPERPADVGRFFARPRGEDEFDAGLILRWQRVTRVLLLLAIVVAALTLAGWMSPLIAARLPSFWYAMKADAAACLLALAIGLLLCTLDSGRMRRRAGRTLGALVLIASLFTLYEFATGRTPGIDRLLVHPAQRALSGPMAPLTAVACALLGAALFGIRWRRRPWAMLVDTIVLALATWALLFAASYLFGAAAVAPPGADWPTAPQGVFCVAVLVAALVFRRARYGLFTLLFRKSVSGAFGRIFVPVAVLLSLLSGFVAIWLSDHRVLPVAYAGAIAVALFSLVLFFVYLWTAERILVAESGLESSELRYRNLVEGSLGLICTHALDGTLLSANPAVAEALGMPRNFYQGRKIQDVLTPRGLAHFDDYIRRLRAHGKDSGVMEVRRSDGAVRLWTFRNVLAQEPGGDPYVLGHAQDTTDERVSLRRLQESEERYRNLFDNMAELVHSVTPNGRFEYVNPAWKRVLGYTDEEIARLTLKDVFTPDSAEAVLRNLEPTFRGDPPPTSRRVMLAKDGRRIEVEGEIRLRRNREGQVCAAWVIYHDVTERNRADAGLREARQALEQALEREKELARIDFLTRLYNRRAFFELGEVELARVRRFEHVLTLAYMDLDNFKQVNDVLGHEEGDALLVTVADTLKSHLRATDIVARLGGDEFAVLLPETAVVAAATLMDKIFGLLKITVHQRGWPITFSCGLVSFDRPEIDFGQMVRQADEMMYLAKKSGKNQIRSAVYGLGPDVGCPDVAEGTD